MNAVIQQADKDANRTSVPDHHNPTQIFKGSVDLAFLDGMHYCE
jgi:hypothetical protein